MFPEGWSLQRIQEEVALVYENTFLKRIGFDKTLKTKEGFITHKYIGKSLSEFDILLDINESGKIINARPII